MKKAALLALFCWLAGICTAWTADLNTLDYHGVRLGDTRAQALEKLGKPRAEIERTVEGRRLLYYFYADDRVGVDLADGRVADIRIADLKFEAPGGVRLGATPHKIFKEYGKAEKTRESGQAYYVYRMADGARVLMDVSAGYLMEIRLTNLSQ